MSPDEMLRTTSRQTDSNASPCDAPRWQTMPGAGMSEGPRAWREPGGSLAGAWSHPPYFSARTLLTFHLLIGLEELC